jgi:hypothetical protein
MSAQPDRPIALFDEAASKGYTPENLPALRQYQLQRESANMEAARRIEDNVRAFLDQPPEST